MGFSDNMRDKLYGIFPGLLGKPPEFSSAKKDEKNPEKSKAPEAKEQKELSTESASHVIPKYRTKENEDRIYVSMEREESEDQVITKDLGNGSEFCAVADGVSSATNFGGVAALEAIKTVTTILQKELVPGMNAEEVQSLLREAMDQAGENIANVFKKMNVTPFNTTFSGYLKYREPSGKETIFVVSVGDSRVMYYDPDAKDLIKATTDDGMTDALFEAGIISSEFAEAVDQSETKGKGIEGPTREELVENIRKTLKDPKRKLRPDQRAKLEFAKDRFEKMRSKISVSEELYKIRNKIFDGVMPEKGGEVFHRVQVKPIDLKPGMVFLTGSDGLYDVVRKKVILQTIEEGLRNNTPASEIVITLAQLAVNDTSSRQKGDFVKNPKTGEVKQTGDDVGIAMSIFREKKLSAEGRRTQEMSDAEQVSVGEAKYNNTYVGTLRSTVEQFKKLQDNLTFYRQKLVEAQGNLATLGGPVHELHPAVLASANPAKLDLSERHAVYVKKMSRPQFQERVREATNFVNAVRASWDLKSLDDTIKKMLDRISLYNRQVLDCGAEIGKMEWEISQKEVGATSAEEQLLRAKAARPELVEGGEEVTVRFGGEDIRMIIKKVKGEHLLVEPKDESVDLRMYISLLDPPNNETVALRQAFEREADALRDAAISEQGVQAKSLAK